MLRILERIGGLLSTIYTFWSLVGSGTMTIFLARWQELPKETSLILLAVLFLVFLLIGNYIQQKKLIALEIKNQTGARSRDYTILDYWDETDSRYSRAVLQATGRLFPKTIIINGKVERIEHPDSIHPSNQ
ncbi:MAG: hypothetical protein OXH65_03305 [Paracoccaceae bacterium]|nr:hypothetical protein [Paracoccaceae bacterium]MDE2674117.1 hypothetical protein [Paracoccaceae bacterium]